ncbi:unnamed protein product [marine sediment metagenome]|uniref:Uncharacterized protein n=1 Tax=marine sediment metagenome TaxID=412755 RepID=X1QGB2_9ZZZZ
MAKLTGPLFSLGAAGAVGKTLVYFGWKGLNVVRQYVVPANPQTKPQGTQRGYLRTCITAIHAAQAAAATPLGEIDTMACALWGSIFPTPRTWFNQIVKNWLDQKVAGKVPVMFRYGVLTPAVNKIKFELHSLPESGLIIKFKVYWGISKTALINSQELTLAEMSAGHDITGMVKSTKYFLQARVSDPATHMGSMSGIYYAKTKAA